MGRPASSYVDWMERERYQGDLSHSGAVTKAARQISDATAPGRVQRP